MFFPGYSAAADAVQVVHHQRAVLLHQQLADHHRNHAGRVHHGEVEKQGLEVGNFRHRGRGLFHRVGAEILQCDVGEKAAHEPGHQVVRPDGEGGKRKGTQQRGGQGHPVHPQTRVALHLRDEVHTLVVPSNVRGVDRPRRVPVHGVDLVVRNPRVLLPGRVPLLEQQRRGALRVRRERGLVSAPRGH